MQEHNKDEEDDILPDTKVDRERTLTGKWALFVLVSIFHIQTRIAQLVAYWLSTGEVPGSNPDKSKNFSVKISNWIVQI